MEVAKLKLEIQSLAEIIRQASKNFTKDGPTRHNVKYKTKKLAELETNWTKFKKLQTKITEQLEIPDTAIDNLRIEIEGIQVNLYNKLLMIPDEDDQQERESEGESEEEPEKTKSNSDESITNFISMQEGRFAGIKRILQQLQDLIDDDEKLNVSWCKIKAQAMNNYWDRIITAHEEMAVNKLPRNYLKTKNKLEEEYEDALIILQEVITPNKSKGEIKLPRIEIPEFRGDYFEWVNFKDLFVALVIENESLSGVQRMQLLKSALKGEAKDLISELILSNANFDVAWGKLVHRFENLKVVVHLFLKKVITLPHLKPDNTDSTQIKQLLDKTDQALEALRNLGRPVDKWDDWIIIIISHKLNEELRREWEKRVGNLNSLPLWKNLKTFLEEEYRIAESLEKSKKKPHQRFQKTDKVSVNQAAIGKERCPNCKQQHSIYNCEGFKKNVS